MVTMSYIIEKKQGNQIYLYKVESYWDKEKKQARQKRKYLGKKVSEQVEEKEQKSVYEAKDYGQIYLMKNLAKEIKLEEILREVYPEEYQQIMELVYYEIIEGNPLYLYESWQEATSLSYDIIKRENIWRLIENIGNKNGQKHRFYNKWIENNKGEAVVFDITSLSSYGKENSLIEWGYNRDKEKLPQCNLGIVYNQQTQMPLYMKIYPGSIVDVSTIKNIVQDLALFGMKESLFVMDRGFYSATNIEKMNEESIKFLIPLPKTTSMFSKLIEQSKGLDKDVDKLFSYKQEVLAYQKLNLRLGEINLDAHVYFNRKRKSDEEISFLRKLLDVEQEILKKEFSSSEQLLDYLAVDNYLTKFFSIDFSNAKASLTRNNKAISQHLDDKGFVILLSNKTTLNHLQVLSLYRQKDSLEKIFDVLKNEFDGNRLRAHSQSIVESRLFIKFLALILYSLLSHKMKSSNLFNLFSIKEIFYELKKLKIISINSHCFYLSELSKKQKTIFSKLSLKTPSLSP
jgi:transposase